ncbi:uncharacterized protein LOC121707225 isoform X8 [Alosa sapidissima]|uniref:uncharacterized protein LOC121707225 isoform X8 n=1 Tax=Alosa sapidissima TaxID=34773 RepID=UPI001C09C5FF|nr:uncharacterized protein LOC121707225 isoform X8 [Alosa sapidissima]
MPRRTTPLQDATNHILAGRDKNSMLEIKYINPVKGRGIFTLAVFNQGDFVVEYRGELIDAAEAEHRRKLYHNACSIFMFDFTWKRKTWCIDGALEDGSFGRLVNDEHKAPNCRMKLIEADGKPHLCLFALKEVMAGTEITYDYGGKEWPWRKETQLSGGSFPSGQHSVAELSDHAHDLEPNVFSTDLFRDTELRAECQSSTPTPDNPVHEVHCVRGQCGTSSAKEGIGEVGVQHQEVLSPVFSAELASETESRSECQSSRAAPNDSACEVHCVRGQCGTSSAKEGIGEVGVQHQEGLSPVFSAELASETESRSGCQSSRATPNDSACEVHCVRGQCGTSPIPSFTEEVGVQHQEVLSPVFSAELASETESRSGCQSSRAVPNDSACECTIHKLVFESVRIDKCWICHSPFTSIRWHGVRCKQCCGVWHKICLQKSSEDWDISDVSEH